MVGCTAFAQAATNAIRGDKAPVIPGPVAGRNLATQAALSSTNVVNTLTGKRNDEECTLNTFLLTSWLLLVIEPTNLSMSQGARAYGGRGGNAKIRRDSIDMKTPFSSQSVLY